MSADNNTQASSQPPKPGPEHKRLDALVGKWKSDGRTTAGGNEPVIKISGTDAYEWLPGGFFLLHHVDVRMGDEQVDTLEIIGGYDASSKTYPMRSFDNQGNFGVMQASVSDDGNGMTAHWEQRSDGSKWRPWMDMTFTKAE